MRSLTLLISKQVKSNKSTNSSKESEDTS